MPKILPKKAATPSLAKKPIVIKPKIPQAKKPQEMLQEEDMQSPPLDIQNKAIA